MFEERYSRQILFSGIGERGQEQLQKSRVLLVGCGALGSVIAEVLTRAGVGQLTVADRDYVDETNLQRQSLFTEEDCREGLPKAVAAARRLSRINGSVELIERCVDVRAGNIESLACRKDLIVDGTDNFETRYLLNDAALRWGIPWTYGACVGAYGMCMTIVPRLTPCLRCVLEQLPPPGSSPTCDTVGVIGPIVHLVAALETAEALKLLTGNLASVNRCLTTVDLWENRISTVELPAPDPECPACSLGQYEFLSGARVGRASELCGRNAVQIWADASEPLDFPGIARRLEAVAHVSYNPYLLKAILPQFEIALFRDGRGIVRGTSDVEEARRVYATIIGN
jgi:adenylyltransferase/sulfurtransferase